MNNPELYSQANKMTRDAAVMCLEKYATKIEWNKGDRLADLGCADGSVTSIMKKYIPSSCTQLVSCDINEKMLDYARKLYADERTTFRALNVEGDIPDDMQESFNHVFCFFLFHWIRDQEKAFRNVYNLLTKGGDLLLSVLKYVPVYEIYEILARDSKWGSTWLSDLGKFISPYYYVEDPEKKIRKIMEDIGFTNVIIERQQITHVIGNGTELRNLFRAVDPYDMPDDVYEEFLQDCIPICKKMGLIDEANKTFDDHNTKINYNYILYVVYATKP